MKVSINWLKELVDLKISIEEVIRLLPLRTIGLKEVTPDYIELDMKGYNRADLLSLRGVAYEIAAITNSEIKFEEEKQFVWEENNLTKTKVTVENKYLAPLYCIARIENLKVEESNETWVKRLNDSGIRAVNNIADVTNLIMVEFGQPMHAFDAAQVADEAIIVKAAKNGEELTTLDGKARKLTPEDLLITDPQKALGLAGVMGGKNSEVTEETSAILLEAAIFDSKTLRKTSTKLGLVSEAGKRFYHGLTKQRLFQALNKAIKMYEEIGGRLTALTIVDNLNQQSITLDLTQKKTNSLIGIEIPAKQVEKHLAALRFKLASHIGSGSVVWEVTVPYWRLDIEIEEDLIEEVTRMYGYEKIPAKALNTNIPIISQNLFFDLLERLKQAFSQAGLTEVQTYSYYSSQVINNLGLRINDLIKIANPISSETEYLRDNLWPNLLEVTAKNTRNGTADAAVFEIGKVYKIQDGLPQESYHLSIALSNGTTNPLQELNQIAQKLNLQLKDQLTGEYFHPIRHIEGIAEVHPRIVNKFKVEQRIAVLELDLSS
ncbi:phenylalanine--tRNA ligase subunit beta [Candidatus Daviesbacteria bacterium]|nr:phenylalanine--tRNA ligase subunit beta [Candidatus Daviesbacteria bacterium]